MVFAFSNHFSYRFQFFSGAELFLCFEGKGGPKHKEFTGFRNPLEGGSRGGGFLAKFFMFMPFLGGLMVFAFSNSGEIPEILPGNALRVFPAILESTAGIPQAL